MMNIIFIQRKDIMKHRIVLIVALLLSVIACSAAYADFETTVFGTQPLTRGAVFTDIANDAYPVMWNPADILDAQHPEGSYLYGYPHTGSDKNSARLNYLYTVFPLKKGINSIGFSWNNFSSSLLPRENTFIVTYAHNFNNIPYINEKLSAGISFKTLLLSQRVDGKDSLDEIFDSNTTDARLTFDIGFVYKPVTSEVGKLPLLFGLAVRNVTQPSFNGAKVPREYRLGAKYNLKHHTMLSEHIVDNVVSSIDVSYRDTDFNVHAGLEAVLFRNNLRCKIEANADEGIVGVGYKWIDYTYVYPYELDKAYRTHYLSVSFNGLSKLRKEEEVQEVKKEVPYLLGPRDVLDIFVRRHPEITMQITVAPDGKITIPLLGDILVEGLTRLQLRDNLKEALKEFINNPDVTITIVEYRSKEVHVLGEVTHSGTYSMEGSIWTVKDAIARAGFPNGIAATWRVFVITPHKEKPEYKIVNLYNILYKGNLEQNIELQPGDIIYVPSTILGKISSSLGHIIDPLYKSRGAVEPFNDEQFFTDSTD